MISKSEALRNLVLMIPLALTQLATTSLGIIGVLIMGWAGADVLAAGTLAVHFFIFFSVFVGGLLTSASPLMAHQLGSGEGEKAKHIAGQALKVAACFAVVGTVITWHTSEILVLMGQPQELAQVAAPFAKANALSFLPAISLLIYRNYAAAAGHPNLGLVTLSAGIFVSAFVGYGTMFGRFGFPDLGLLGLGLTTTCVNVLMFLIVFTLVQRQPGLGLSWRHLSGRQWVPALLKIGAPIGFSGLGSVGTFVAATFFIALLGKEQVAGHAIALQAANVGFAILWGGAQATTIRIGWATGARDQQATEIAAWTGVFNVFLASLSMGIVFLIFRKDIVGLFLDESIQANQASVQIAVTVMLAVGLYQFVNGPQLVATSALRGLRDTTIPFLISLSGFWIVGGIFAGTLGFLVGLGAAGVWFGLCGAVCISSSILIYRLKRLLPMAMTLTDD